MEVVNIATSVLTLILLAYVSFFMLFKKGYLAEKGKITAKIESDIIMEFYDYLKEFRITIIQIDAFFTQQPPTCPNALTEKKKELAGLLAKLNECVNGLSLIITIHNTTYLAGFEPEFNKIEEAANSYIKSVNDSNTKDYQKHGTRLNQVLKEISEKLYKRNLKR